MTGQYLSCAECGASYTDPLRSRFCSHDCQWESERRARELKSKPITRGCYIPSPAMRKSIQAEMANVEIPFGMACERAELER